MELHAACCKTLYLIGPSKAECEKNSVKILTIGESALLENQLSLEVTGCCQSLSHDPCGDVHPCVSACVGGQVLFVSDASDTPADMVRLVSSVFM